MIQGLPLASLGAWLAERGLADVPVVTATPLAGGQSNPTFRVTTDRGVYVLRKKPAGVLLPSAHAIDREYRVMRALHATAVPVPAMLAWCDDASVLGTPFYVMEFLAGRVLVDPSLPSMSRDERRAIYAEMNRTIGLLHGLDPVDLGLGDYGKPTDYVARQVARWSRQSGQAQLPLPAAMRRLMEWLPEHIPATASSALVHGDYRLDNLVFHPTEPRVIGVLDWELSTLGDPLADFAYHCMSWRIPAQLWRGIGGLDLAALGIPGESEYAGVYSKATGRDAAEHWEFYMTYNLFRMAAILHGIAQRAADGTAGAVDAADTGAKAELLAEIGWQSALRYG